MPQAAPILATQNLIKRFPGVIALKGVSFDLRPGEIHALCGENGAGKSTLIKTLGGIHPAGSYEGTIRVNNQDAAFANSRDAQRNGIGVINQELALVPEMTVAENVFLGSEPTGFLGLIDKQTMLAETRRLLDRFGLAIDPTVAVSTLGVGRRQLVEIAKALSKETRILILDEPTAALTEQEVAVLLDILRDLRRRGISMIYISHKLDEVFAIADRITILRDGRSIITLESARTNEGEVIRHMVGREIADLFPRRPTKPGLPVLCVRGLCVQSAGSRVLSDIHFDVHAGEVLGIGGLMGAGRTELLMHLFGAFGSRISGTVTLDGRDLPGSLTPPRAIRRGLVLVSEDRKRYGLILDKSINFNLSLSSLRGIRRAGLLSRGLEAIRNKPVFDSLGIRAPHPDVIVGTLSGGNQQKVVVGKALLAEPRVIFLDEPTRGIDVGAKVELYELINSMTAAQKAVVLVSSELPELMGMSDRIIMLHEGRIGGRFTRDQATQENLLAAAMGRWKDT